MARMTGRNAMVTGAGAGIGRATALAFARQGAGVIVSDIHEAGVRETARMVGEQGGVALPIAADVADAHQVAGMVAAGLGHFGHIDFAFNNAGVEGRLANTSECSEANWDRTLAVNLKGVWLCMRHQLPSMLARRSGAIVNCSSVAGLIGFPGLPAYVASKHGIVGLTRTAALECAGHGVRVNAICPGVIGTAMVERLEHDHPGLDLVAREPMGRMGTPDEIAAAVIWLCSDDASFVTGQALAVDGGFVAQ